MSGPRGVSCRNEESVEGHETVRGKCLGRGVHDKTGEIFKRVLWSQHCSTSLEGLAKIAQGGGGWL